MKTKTLTAEKAAVSLLKVFNICFIALLIFALAACSNTDPNGTVMTDYTVLEREGQPAEVSPKPSAAWTIPALALLML